MTFVVTINGERSIWAMADRRLTYRDRKPKDDARKLLMLDTPDGIALLGYAGLGSTAGGTEPSDWMARVLTSQNVPLEHSLTLLRDAIQLRFPKHLNRASIPHHSVLAVAFLNGQRRLYSIDLMRLRDGTGYKYRLVRVDSDRGPPDAKEPPKLICTGSGSPHLRKRQELVGHLRKVVKAHDAGRISAHVVATELASVNAEIADKECTVGKRCQVAWRLKGGAGSVESFTGTSLDQQTLLDLVPRISNGQNVTEIIRKAVPIVAPVLRLAKLHGENVPSIDEATLRAAFDYRPDQPDDTLD